MTTHLDIYDPQYAAAAAEILRRHDSGQPEANITSAVRDFLTLTGLARPHEIVEENPPAETSRRAVDLTALDTFIEFKRRIGGGGFVPDPAYVQQLDDYLAQSQRDGKGVRTGILTDGKRWLLRWPGAGPVNTAPPYGFVLESPDGWLPLYEWLRDRALFALEQIPADRAGVEQHLGPQSAAYRRDIDTLAALYANAANYETVQVKRRLWHDLLRAALGEIAHDPAELDSLFIRHTYLSIVIGMAVQASFGIDIRQLAATDPSDLLQGRRFRSDTGLGGVIESDFFAWPDEFSSNQLGGHDLIKTLARRIARFDWPQAPPDIAAILYETVIPAGERRTLGEYYTPGWLARMMARELIADPLRQRVLDPACGSGAFIAAAVAHFLAAAGDGYDPKERLDRLRRNVAGIDVHPVAVHLARAAWALAARPAIDAAVRAGYDASGSVPVYLGDALQLRFRAGDLFAGHQVTIQVNDAANSELAFPISLVEQADAFDSLMSQVAADIESGQDPLMALDDHAIADPGDRATLAATINTLQRLHADGRDHIWAYYTRNLVRPVAMSRHKVDVIIGNPPWLNYNQTADVLRTELERQSKDRYGIWVGGRYASNQDVAGLFFARCVDLYLKDGGVIGMVLPHSALQSGQYTKWRSGEWQSRPAGRGRRRTPGRTLAVNFARQPAWDLEPLEPNTFFPIASCVAFAERIGENAGGTALAGAVERWQGRAGADDVRRVYSGITDTSVSGDSPYAGYSRQGASIRPRRLFFVEEIESPVVVQAGQTVMVNPRRGGQDKEPWRNLDLTAISGQTIESRHLYDVYLGETVVPYATLEPLQVILPVRRGEYKMPTDADGLGGIRMGGLERRMRGRWQTINDLWEDNKPAASKLNLLENLDHYRKLSSQLEWQRDKAGRPVRVVYGAAGQPTAALVSDDNSLIDERLYWITCKDMDEANYLLAIINSDALAIAVNKYTTPNWSGKTRDLHKHLWKLAIPEFDGSNFDHQAVAEAGAWAAEGAAARLGELRAARGYGVSVAIARRELRGWLRGSAAGAVVEAAVEQLMDWPEVKTDEYRQRQEERKQRFGLAFGIDSGTAIRADRAVRAAQQP